MRIRTQPGLGVGIGRWMGGVSGVPLGGFWDVLGGVGYFFDFEDTGSAGLVNYGCFHL